MDKCIEMQVEPFLLLINHKGHLKNNMGRQNVQTKNQQPSDSYFTVTLD